MMYILLLFLMLFMAAEVLAAWAAAAWAYRANLRGEVSREASVVLVCLSVLVGGMMVWLTYQTWVFVAIHAGSTP